jgi:hypothetical protein
VTHAASKRRGHGEDSIYWDESRKRYIGAVDLGISPAGTRICKKVSGKTKVEVRDTLRELHKETDAGLRPRTQQSGACQKMAHPAPDAGARAPDSRLHVWLTPSRAH